MVAPPSEATVAQWLTVFVTDFPSRSLPVQVGVNVASRVAFIRSAIRSIAQSIGTYSQSFQYGFRFQGNGVRLGRRFGDTRRGALLMAGDRDQPGVRPYDPRMRGFRDRASVEDVLALIGARVRALGPEAVGLFEASGRVLAGD